MNKIAPLLAAAAAVVAVTAVRAADAPPKEGHVSMVYSDNVAPAQQEAYEAAVKAFNHCLAQHDFKFTWTALVHETGNTYEYSYVSPPGTWADFDTMRTQGQPCFKVWRSQANPYLKSESAAFIVELPGLSHAKPNADAPGPILAVTFFTLKQGHQYVMEFNDAVKKITAAAAKSKWPYYFTTYRFEAADHGAPDYVVVSRYMNWADYGADAKPSLWKMVENVYGKKDQLAIRKSINDALANAYSHVDRVNADLTYTAPTH